MTAGLIQTPKEATSALVQARPADAFLGNCFAAFMPCAESLGSPELPEPLERTWIDEVRAELAEVQHYLIDPSAEALNSSLPHLERAILLFEVQLAAAVRPEAGPEIDLLRNGLEQANRLFEGAYALRAGLAAEVGLNMDGSTKPLLYGRTGDGVAGTKATVEAQVGNWQG